MGKIFEISGNVMENGEWIQPDPSFTGKIALCDDGHIRGYCDEQRDTKELRRYIFGKFGKSERSEKEGFVFFMLSKEEPTTPTLLFVINDLDGNSDNEWAEMHGMGFRPKGDAKVVLEEVKPDKEYEYDAIIAQFEDHTNANFYIGIFDRFSTYFFE